MPTLSSALRHRGLGGCLPFPQQGGDELIDRGLGKIFMMRHTIGELVQLQTARRFSEFIYLNDSLFPDTEFPVPKRWFGFSYAVVDERTAGLQDYLNRTVHRPPPSRLAT